MALKIYVVKNEGSERLIEAKSKSEALSFAVRTTMEVALASQSDLVTMISAGKHVESVIDAAGEPIEV